MKIIKKSSTKSRAVCDKCNAVLEYTDRDISTKTIVNILLPTDYEYPERDANDDHAYPIAFTAKSTLLQETVVCPCCHHDVVVREYPED